MEGWGWGGITWGEMLDIGDGEEGSKPHCCACTYATISPVLHMYPKTYNAIKKRERVEGGYQGLEGGDNREMMVKGHKLAVIR